MQAADQENEQRRRLELAAAVDASKVSNEEIIKKNKINQKKQQVKYIFIMLLRVLSVLVLQ